MKKKIRYDDRAFKELERFSKNIQSIFAEYIEMLGEKGKLEFPEARKVSKNIFEIRIIHEGSYRGFYGYAQKNFIVILHFFQKKSQRTPIKELETAQQRLKQYE